MEVLIDIPSTDDKKFLREKIVEKYSDRIDDKKLKRILGFKIKGWGNLSKELYPACGVGCRGRRSRQAVYRR